MKIKQRRAFRPFCFYNQTNKKMLEFKRLKEDFSEIKEYLIEYGGGFCDLSLGVRYMWRDDFVVDYAIFNHTLIMKETSPDYENAFYFPLGNDVLGALEKIEEYSLSNFLPLKFCCIDNATAVLLTERYNRVSISNDRDWSDYIYDAEKFKTYSGKKFGGQRNHVNKFKKLYPNYQFKQIEKEDFPRIKEFLNEFNSKTEFLRWSEAVEQKKVFSLVEKMFELNQVGGLIDVDGKVVAFSVGERIGDTLIVHIEKALVKYDGVYPLMAQEFAKAFGDGIKFINREEDCGDDGLRISKLQYRPIDVKEKNFVKVKTLFEKINSPILLKADQLYVTDIFERDKERYCELYMDDELNKWWGYDYCEDLGEETPSPDYFFSFQQKLKDKKEEYALAVKKDNQMIGELVLHNFDYFGGVEIGFRFFKESQGKGYATKSVTALMDYAKNVLGAKKLKTRCFKENKPSFNLIGRLGFKMAREDNTHYYFEKE